jgi:hypothetical protein
MIVSHAKRLVILRPWKTASSTIAARLRSCCETPYDRFYDFNPFLNRVVHQHLTYADFCALPESSLGYAVASFVRNPYDRAYSGFIQLQRDQRDQPGARYPVPWIRDLVLRQLAEISAQLAAAGSDFDRWLTLVEEWQVYEAGRNTSFPLLPAHYWTHADGRQAVDFVGRVEEFEVEFARLRQMYDIESAGTVNENVTVDPGQTGRFGYKYAHLMSAESIDRIERLFDPDFSLFGYERVSHG